MRVVGFQRSSGIGNRNVKTETHSCGYDESRLSFNTTDADAFRGYWTEEELELPHQVFDEPSPTPETELSGWGLFNTHTKRLLRGFFRTKDEAMLDLESYSVEKWKKIRKNPMIVPVRVKLKLDEV